MTVCAFLVLATSICRSEDSTPSTGSTSSPQASAFAGSRQARYRRARRSPNRPQLRPLMIKKLKLLRRTSVAATRLETISAIARRRKSNVVADVKAPDVNKPPLIVRTVSLKFLNAANLKTAIDKMSSANGSISVNENTNSLIVCDTEENLKKILAEIQKADQTPKQMIIEVVIIDVQLKNDTEIGVDWDVLRTPITRT